MAHELNRDNRTQSPRGRNSLATATTPDSGAALERAAETLGQILDRYRISKGWQPLSDDDHDLMVAAWLEVLSVAGVPVEQFDACYRAARQTQIEARAKGGDAGPLGADDLAAEWIKIRQFNDEMSREEMKHRQLAAVNPRHCLRCYGTGKEELVDGSVREGCVHTPMSDEEAAERTRLQRERIQFAREQAKRQIGAPKEPMQGPPKPPPGVWLTCSKCPRKVNVLHYEPGERCNDFLNRGDNQAEPVFCDGTLEA